MDLLTISDDPNLNDYDSSSQNGKFVADTRTGASNASPRSKSLSRTPSTEQSSNYATTLNDIRRLRSKDVERTISNQPHKPRRSRVLGGPDSETVTPNNDEERETQSRSNDIKIEEDVEVAPEVSSSDSTSKRATMSAPRDRSITFEDLNRLVASEQSKNKRPMSFLRKSRTRSPTKKAGGLGLMSLANSSNGELTRPEGRDVMVSNDSSLSLQMRTKTYFSELSALELFIVRHIAVMSLEPLVKDHFNMEELLDLIETRKVGFWGKFGKAFKPPKEKTTKEKDDKKGVKRKGVFGVSLETLIERSSADSSLGVGPQTLRVPGFIADVIEAMKDMDMSIEGVFRKNGNIRRLKQLADDIDKNPEATNLSQENAVQLAALLKKFLRDLPDPLMTFKLHKLFVSAQQCHDEDIKYRILHLTCCLLPKAHRDTMEVVFTFFTWVAQFAQVDEDSGSKMDEHNLATVVTPNVLYSKNSESGMDDSFAAIETVHAMIKYSGEFACVPEDLMLILHDTSLFSNSADLTTKDILKRCEDKLGSRTATSSNTVEAITRQPGDRPRPPVRVDTDAAQVYASVHESTASRQGPMKYGSTSSLPLPPSPSRNDPRRDGGRSVSDRDPERALNGHRR